MKLKCAFQEITPEIAKQMLESNTKNRKVTQSRVARYAKLMAEGKWTVTGDAICFSVEGTLMNGQHRLLAIVRSGVTVWMIVVIGFDWSCMPAMDGQKPRDPSDAFEVEGHVDTSAVAAALRKVEGYLTGRPDGKFYLDNFRALEMLEEHPLIKESVRKVGRYRLLERSLAAGLHYLMCMKDVAAADEFFQSLDRGTGLKEGSSIFVLRERLISNSLSKSKLPEVEKAALTIKAWNLFRKGHEVKQLKWMSGGATPEAFPIIQ